MLCSTLNNDRLLSTGAALTANLRPLRTDLSYPACITSGNFILEFPGINSRSRLFSRWRMRASPRGLWSRRQVCLPRMRQRDACWAGEVSLKGSHIARMRDGSPVSRYLYIDLCCYLLTCVACAYVASSTRGKLVASIPAPCKNCRFVLFTRRL